MQLKPFSIVILKILSIYLFIVYVVGNFTNLLHFLFSSGEAIIQEESIFTLSLWFNIATIILFFAISIILWRGAFRISELIIREEESEANHVEVSNYEKLFRYGVGLLGLYLLLSGIPEILYKLVLGIKVQSEISDIRKNLEILGVIEPLAKMIIGLICIYWPMKIIERIKRNDDLKS